MKSVTKRTIMAIKKLGVSVEKETYLMDLNNYLIDEIGHRYYMANHLINHDKFTSIYCIATENACNLYDAGDLSFNEITIIMIAAAYYNIGALNYGIAEESYDTAKNASAKAIINDLRLLNLVEAKIIKRAASLIHFVADVIFVQIHDKPVKNMIDFNTILILHKAIISTYANKNFDELITKSIVYSCIDSNRIKDDNIERFLGDGNVNGIYSNIVSDVNKIHSAIHKLSTDNHLNLKYEYMYISDAELEKYINDYIQEYYNIDFDYMKLK